MDSAAIPEAALDSLDVLARQVADLVRVADPAAVPPGMRWTVREIAAHLVGSTTLYTELAAGSSSPLDAITPEALRAFNDERIADVTETDPDKLATTLSEAVTRFLGAARDRATTVTWHAGIVLDPAQFVGVLMAEHLLHGLDVATAAGAPWPIDPSHAALVLQGYAPVLPACVNPGTAAGHTAGYLLDLGDAGSLAVRFTDGAVTVTPDDGRPYACEITADPTAFLLVSTGRMPQSTAVALRLLGAAGKHPELGLTFGSRFRYP